MNLSFHRFDLPLEHEFKISRESTSVQPTLVVELEQDGVSGFGESTENRFYGHSLDSIIQSIDTCRSILSAYEFGTPMQLWNLLREPLSRDSFALAALDLAAYDLYGKLTNRRTYEVLDIQWDQIPASSYTIGIASLNQMVEKLRERPNWSIYKVKLGTDRDVEIIRQLREHTDAIFRVDANCGWTADETIENSYALKELGVEFIEQPLPADAADEDHVKVFKNSILPIVADESCQIEANVENCSGHFHGVNVKLCKCGGLTPATRMLRQARSLGMKTMVGCMVESSVGISAAAQLLPLLDYADLDGAVLISEDPAVGAVVDNGIVGLGDGFGNGVQLR